MQAEVFPDFAVKQAFRELKKERDDDMVIGSIQSDLVTRCVVQLLKGAIVSCIIHKRKYINERDVLYALNTTHYPRSNIRSKDQGYLLDTRHFGTFCTKHIDILVEILKRQHMVEAEQIKVSSDILVILQENTERLLRGFMEQFSNSHSNCLGYRQFDNFMNEIVGEKTSTHEVFSAFDG